MCKMWLRITSGVKWNPQLKLDLAINALNLSKVKSINISMDPFHSDNFALREFWYHLSRPEVRQTNVKLGIKSEVRNDGKPPYFVADLDDNRKILFQTAGMKTSDVIMRFNRLLGNPELEVKPAEEV